MMLYVVGIILFICISVYAYIQFVQPKLNPTYIQNREFEAFYKLDNTEQQQNIIDKEKMFTSDKGNVCIFDPAGMHRGGICNKGTRVALQILMK